MNSVLTKALNPSALGSRTGTPAHCLLVRIYPVDEIEKPLEFQREPLLVGRDASCSLTIDADSVSRRHALIEFDGRSHTVTDLGSTNGTYINDQRVHSVCALHNGDRIRFGNHIYKYLTADQIEMHYHEVVFSMMTTDGLTSVYNKRYFLETLDRELMLSCRSGSPLALIMIDLDKFKSVNDSYGHLAGDAVLVEFARRARAVLRSGELLSRYGGEEFAMLLTKTTLVEAEGVAERVRQVIAKTPIVYESVAIPITVSLGVSCYAEPRPLEPASLIAHADSLLYAAKHNGRDQFQSAAFVPVS